MTGLPNRIAFNERLAFDAAEAHEKAHKLAAFSIDIDGFKDVNDVFGHGAGDLLLIEVADRMRADAGPRRISGAPKRRRVFGPADVGQPPARCPGLCRTDRRRVRPTVRGRRTSRSRLTASIGFSIFPIDTPERDQVLSNAKLAMHRGKSKQRGMICQYHREMDDTARARRALARDLQLAAERDELELHYQLQTTLADGKDLRRRSADALAASQARHDLAGGIHSAGRRNRSHRRDGRMGAAHRLPRCRRRQDSRHRRGQPVAGAVQPRRSCRDHPRDPAGDRTVAEAAGGRSHGIDHHVGPDPRACTSCAS